MEKLRKLEINPERLMKDEELVVLRGGYSGPCTCFCFNIWTTFGYLLSESGDCPTDCLYAFQHNATGVCQYI